QRRVWIKDKDLAWVKATVLSEGDKTQDSRMIVVENDDTGDKHELEVDASGEGEGVKSLNLFEDDSDVRGYEHVNDLTNLAHLHEAEILEALCVRFKSDVIYTYTGPILLAVNPFKSLNIYSEDKLSTFYSAGLLKSQNIEAPVLEPHVFAIADNAYRSLTGGGSGKSSALADQSILVSGESGAGKTETTKYVMRFLATVAKPEDDKSSSSGTGMAERVLESNPILESFGNARTNRNDNSSRFGKFIQMSFDPKGFLVGAQIATYLLEKVRLTKQGEGERNFHVFYQMCAGASPEDRQAWLLPEIDQAAYTNESGVYDRRDNVLDQDQFVRTDEAFVKMKFSSEERNAIYSIASAVLNMGNITFGETGEGAADIAQSASQFVSNVATLLQVDNQQLVVALTTKNITTGKETFVKPLDVAEAMVIRDALAKTVFSRLFDWLVMRVNSAIASTESASSTTTTAAATAAAKRTKNAFIGVLDIFGFEVFVHNSFEQLCINYANETLQQQFNEFIFQLEQKLYESEKITWAFIDFPDNKPVLDLIEQKAPKPGILTMLDEQCVVPGGNDKTFANKLYEAHGGGSAGAGASPAKPAAGAPGSAKKPAAEDDPSLLLFASKIDKVKFNFSVRHYAGAVSYNAIGFCAKNKDELREEALVLMRTSTSELVISLFPETGQKKGSIQSTTVGGQFKAQLASLLTTIKATSPHYVRCLKPNDINVRDVLVRPRLVDQLRYGGVLEAVKVARAGYPTRYSLRDFVRRYFMLSQNLQQALSRRAQSFPEDDPRWVEACEAIVNGPQHLEKKAQYQIGKTKVFLRKSAFEKLESGRSQVLRENAIQIQKIGRGMVHFKRFNLYMRSLQLIQRVARGFIARRRVRAMKRNSAAVVIQTTFRGYYQWFRFNQMKAAAVRIQSLVRGKFGRQAFQLHKENVMATQMQCFVRMSLLRKRFLQRRRGAIAFQTRWRGMAARMELKRLKEEQREVGFFKIKIEELNKKVIELDNALRLERQGGGGRSQGEEEPEAKKKREMDAQEFALVVQERDALRVQIAANNHTVEGDTVPESAFIELKLALEIQKVENERLIEQQKQQVGTGQENGDGELRVQLETTAKERDQLKLALAQASSSALSNDSSMEGEISALKLKHEIELAQLAQERDTLMEGSGGSGALLGKTIAERDSMKLEVSEWQLKFDQLTDLLSSEKQAHLDIQFELTKTKQDRDLKVQQIGNLETELSAQTALAVQVRKERDDLAAGVEGTALIAKAFEERDLASAKLAASITEAESLRHQISSLQSDQANQRELVSTLKSSLDLAAAANPHHELQAELARALLDKESAEQERNSLAELMSVSGEEDGGFQRIIAEREKSMAQQRHDFELEIKKLKLERDSVEHSLRQEKKLAAKALEEKQMLLESLQTNGVGQNSGENSTTSVTSPVVISPDLLKLETERARLLQELKVVEKERDDVKQQFALHKVMAHSKSSSVGGGADLDLQIAKSSLEELSLSRDLMIKEKDDLVEENAKLKQRVEELVVLEEALKSKITDLTAAPARNRFFSRAPAAVPSLVGSVGGAATAAGNGDVANAALTSRIKELEAEYVQVKKQKEDLLSRTMHLMSEMANKEIDMKKQKRSISDLEEKIDAMSLLAEQTSAIKIKLARRLDSLVQENHRLLQSLQESEDQLAAMVEVTKVLNTELQRKEAPAPAAATAAVVVSEE
ncbi:hypothetical protein BASA81_016551, partial [Batrachochytrium salamandrivorans]